VKSVKRYVVIDPNGAIVGQVKSAKGRSKAQKQADRRWGPGCTLTKTWMTGGVFRLWLRERARCHLCGGNVPLNIPERDPRAASRDHLVPYTLGGRRTPENIRLAHRFCNSRRNHRDVDDMAPETYVALLEKASRGLPAPGAA
jgi:5-methylcytosine-specific restriction endonuclease McrA